MRWELHTSVQPLSYSSWLWRIAVAAVRMRSTAKARAEVRIVAIAQKQLWQNGGFSYLLISTSVDVCTRSGSLLSVCPRKREKMITCGVCSLVYSSLCHRAVKPSAQRLCSCKRWGQLLRPCSLPCGPMTASAKATLHHTSTKGSLLSAVSTPPKARVGTFFSIFEILEICIF